MGQQIIVGVIIGLVMAAVAGLVAYFTSRGYNMKSQEAVTDKLNEHATMIAHQQTRLNEHMSNSDAHWTPRERDALTEQISRIEDGVQTLLKRSSGDLRP